jgi:hypothetical protein
MVLTIVGLLGSGGDIVVERKKDFGLAARKRRLWSYSRLMYTR